MEKNYKRIFITHILPESLLHTQNIPVAANNFSFNLMSGGGFDKVFSIAGTDVKGELDKIAFQDSRFELVYRQSLRKRGGVWVKISALLEQVEVYKKIPKGAKLWFYNITAVSGLLYILLFFFKRSVQLNVIVLDYTPTSGKFNTESMFLKLINKAHSLIKLSNSDLFTCSNYAILPGVTPKHNDAERVRKMKNVFLLSGMLSEQIAQPLLVIDVFSKLPECTLHITGIAKEKEEEIKNKASLYPNIIYHGKVKAEEYFDLLQSVTFVLSTRDPNYPENLCNFPSKIIESLLYNRAIVSTIIYPQIEEIKYFVIDSDPVKMREQIMNIVSMSEESLSKYINQGEKVSELYNTDVWIKTMNRLERN